MGGNILSHNSTDYIKEDIYIGISGHLNGIAGTFKHFYWFQTQKETIPDLVPSFQFSLCTIYFSSYLLTNKLRMCPWLKENEVKSNFV